MHVTQKDFPALYEPAFDSLLSYIEYYAVTTPSAIVCIDENGEHLTYAQLKTAAYALAANLKQHGITKRDRVATLTPPSSAFLISFLACNIVEAIWVGINPKYKTPEVDHILSTATPKLILLREQPNPEQGSAAYQHLTTHQLPKLYMSRSHNSNSQEIKSPNLSADDTAMLVFTSGSSGTPKAACISHQAITIAARRRVTVWGASPIRIVNYLPINHIGGASDISGPALISGGTIIFQERFEPKGLLELVERHKVTVLPGVPTSLQYCTDHAEDYDLSSLQLVIFSGGSASKPLLERFNTITPKTVTSYGMTESSASITMAFPVADATVLENFIGFTTPEFSMRLEGEGNEGEIQVKGPTVTKGYWENTTATTEAFTEDGWYKTGDIAEHLENGGFKLIGRAKEMFKSGGYNVYPREVECALEQHPAVEAAVIVAVPDPLFIEVGHAFVTLRSNETTSPDDMIIYLKEQLANYKIPKNFVIKETLPTLPNGKVDRSSLKKTANESLDQ